MTYLLRILTLPPLFLPIIWKFWLVQRRGRPACVNASECLCTFGDPCKRGASTVNSPPPTPCSAPLPSPWCSLQQVGFRCYANLPSGLRLRRGRPRPLHLIPRPPLLPLLRSLEPPNSIFFTSVQPFFFSSPCFSTPHVITPQPPPPSHSPLFFPSVFLAPPLRVSIPAGLR